MGNKGSLGGSEHRGIRITFVFAHFQKNKRG
jgi:hypothetical protein